MSIERFPVEQGHVLQFCRAIGDADPAYTDAGAARSRGLPGPVAPPTFLHAAAHYDPVHHLRPRPGVSWHGSGGSAGRLPDSDGRPRLHAEQHYRYERPVRVGEVLNAVVLPGRTWEKSGRAGLLQFAETITEFRDDDGHLVAESRLVTVKVPTPDQT
jgi:hydroxyacyl-ACP dehydratase HTD2-like protein with hotdog domain